MLGLGVPRERAGMGDEGMKYVFCAATEEFLEMMGIVHQDLGA